MSEMSTNVVKLQCHYQLIITINTMQTKYMTLKEAADYMHKSERSMLRIIEYSRKKIGPKLPVRRSGPGGQYLFIKEDLDKYSLECGKMTDAEVNAAADRKLMKRKIA